MLLDKNGVAEILKCSPSGVQKFAASGRLPSPVRIGRCVRWCSDELAAWVAAGCPSLDRWEAIKKANRKGGVK